MEEYVRRLRGTEISGPKHGRIGKPMVNDDDCVPFTVDVQGVGFERQRKKKCTISISNRYRPFGRIVANIEPVAVRDRLRLCNKYALRLISYARRRYKSRFIRLSYAGKRLLKAR